MAGRQPCVDDNAALRGCIERYYGRYVLFTGRPPDRERRHHRGQYRRLGREGGRVARRTDTELHTLFMGDEQPLVHEYSSDTGRAGRIPLPAPRSREV